MHESGDIQGPKVESCLPWMEHRVNHPRRRVVQREIRVREPWSGVNAMSVSQDIIAAVQF